MLACNTHGLNQDSFSLDTKHAWLQISLRFAVNFTRKGFLSLLAKGFPEVPILSPCQGLKHAVCRCILVTCLRIWQPVIWRPGFGRGFLPGSQPPQWFSEQPSQHQWHMQSPVRLPLSSNTEAC